MKSVYFDANSTTSPSAKVLAALPELALVWGNPSSIHWAGRASKNLLREARQRIAQSMNAHPLNLVFTSGGSESNNSVIRGVYEQTQTEKLSPVYGRNHFMCSAVEHPSVLKAFEAIAGLGAEVDIIPVSKDGDLDLDFLVSRLSSKTALVSVMAANNETGVIYPIKSLSQVVQKCGSYFHTDAVQAYGKIPVDVSDWGVNFASFSAHKVYALKGTGVTYIKKGSVLSSFVTGGGQERGRRGGTENILGIGALGVSAGEVSEMLINAAELSHIRDYFETRILSEISGTQVTGARSLRLPNTSSLILPGCDGETLLMNLDLEGYAVSTGAACSSGNPEPSPVLLAMGLSHTQAQNSLRVSFSLGTTQDQVDLFIEKLKIISMRLRQLSQEEVRL